MAEAHAIIGIRLLIIPAERQHLLVERQGTVILLERKITLGIHPVIERKLMGRQTLQLRNHLIKKPDGFGILPLIIQAHRQISPVAGIQLVTSVERLEQHQALMKLLGSEVIQSPRQLLGISLPIPLLHLKGSAFFYLFECSKDGLKAQKLLPPERAKVSTPGIEQSDIEQSGFEQSDIAQPAIEHPGKLPQTSRLQTNTLNFIYSSSPFSYSDS